MHWIDEESRTTDRRKTRHWIDNSKQRENWRVMDNLRTNLRKPEAYLFLGFDEDADADRCNLFLTFATEKMAPRFGDLFNFEKPYLLNRWAHSAQQINKVY